MSTYDETQAIGRRYRRQMRSARRLCHLDFDSLEDRAVTIRDRDTWPMSGTAADLMPAREGGSAPCAAAALAALLYLARTARACRSSRCSDCGGSANLVLSSLPTRDRPLALLVSDAARPRLRRAGLVAVVLAPSRSSRPRSSMWRAGAPSGHGGALLLALP